MQHVALIGNPNSGKSTLFNLLAGTRQKVGNYPGVTVDVKSAVVEINGEKIELLDMPGLYSMYPNGAEERLVVDVLMGAGNVKSPDAVVYTVDATLLESQMMLATQLIDLGYPILLAINMIDELEKHDLTIDVDELEKQFGVPVISVSSRTGENIDGLRAAISKLANERPKPSKSFYKIPSDQVNNLRYVFFDTEEIKNEYNYLLRLHHGARQSTLTGEQSTRLEELKEQDVFQPLPAQVDETMARAEQIKKHLAFVIVRGVGKRFDSNWFDRILTDKVAGPMVFILLMLFVFQAIFAWATYPMDWIENGFAWLSGVVNEALPQGWFSSLITDGLLAGLSGVLVFVPQIAILFFLITILEEVGYMARAVYLFDRLLQSVGMNGRSVVALISGGACAIPAIMSTRTIENWNERLITILVTPFISCSARIPVFVLLVAFVVPYEEVLGGLFNTQGLVFAGLYALGVAAALSSAWVFKKILRSRDMSYLVLELPKYRWPDWPNVWVQVRSKVGTFITEAGKIIVLISLVLWVLASFGPKQQMESAEQQAQIEAAEEKLTANETNDLIAARKLEVSFAGHIGKFIEPVIKPLGYDWKIGIALITSFAAREVFVGSMATIYSVGSEEDTLRIREQLAKVKDPVTGKPVFNQATALSLIFFFLLAMQCMSTLAVVKKETGTWKWPVIQFTFMSLLAYLVSLLAYQILS